MMKPNDQPNDNIEEIENEAKEENDSQERDDEEATQSCIISYKLTSEAAFFWSCLCTYHYYLCDKGEQYWSKILLTAATNLKRYQ